MNTKAKIFSSLALTGMLFSATGGFNASAMANDGGDAPKTTYKTTSYKTTTSSSNTYTVKQGDTLGAIASKFGTSYKNIMALNGLFSTTIYTGQTLKVKGTVKASTQAVTKTSNSTASTPQYKRSTQASTTTQASATGMAGAAKVALAQVGTPYKWAGKAPGGFDCSGLVYYAAQQAGANIGYATSAGYYSMGTSVSTPQVGDLVFFKDTYKAGISHVGIYVGNGQMVSAASGGVQVDDIHGAYWGDHFVGYKRM